MLRPSRALLVIIGISVVLRGDMLRDLDGPRLRVVLAEVLAGERKELPESTEVTRPLELAGSEPSKSKTTSAQSAS